MKKIIAMALILTLVLAALSGCGSKRRASDDFTPEQPTDSVENTEEVFTPISLTSTVTELENGLSAVRFDGDDGFEDFLAAGGASSDGEVVTYLAEHLLDGLNLGFLGNMFGCSTIAVTSPEGNHLFGRNFDWENCEAMVVISHPENGYASISTVNMDFITAGTRDAVRAALKMDQVRTLAALYAPLDGMNEAGLAVSVNMIRDSATIAQNTDKPDITTTTAVRLLLNKAGSVEDALSLLGQYDLHASMGMMIHFALTDRTGRSVVVEYIDQEMVVTETPVVTNFYLAEGEKHGIGTQQSHERYDILTELLEQRKTMSSADVRDALERVSKKNFDDYASTEWSIVFDLDAGTAQYYHRENYEQQYAFSLTEGE